LRFKSEEERRRRGHKIVNDDITALKLLGGRKAVPFFMVLKKDY